MRIDLHITSMTWLGWDSVGGTLSHPKALLAQQGHNHFVNLKMMIDVCDVILAR